MSRLKILSRLERDPVLTLLKLIQSKAGTKTINWTKTIKPENVIVEYGSPNIAKPLHMGHLRSTVTGHYVARICKHAGHNVTSMCFLGDWGTQFAVLQAGLAKWIETDSVEASVDKLDIRSLLDYYIRAVKEKDINDDFSQEIKKYSSALESSDPTAIRIWSAIREKTLNHLKIAWEQLGIHYDVVQGESEYAINSNYTSKVLEILKEKGMLTQDLDGCTYALLSSPQGKEMRVPLVKNDGSSLYLLRDVAAAKSRSENFNFGRMIYVVDKSQSHHFSNLFQLLNQFGYVNSKSQSNSQISTRRVQHVSFGKIEGMSTRAGNFVLLSDAIKSGLEFMTESRKQSPNTRHGQDESISLQLALSALVVYSLKRRRNRDFQFDWAEAIKPIGETGIKLQYTHARIKSLEEKQTFNSQILSSQEMFLKNFDMEYIQNDPIALDIIQHLLTFEDSFWRSYEEFEPCILLTYLFKLCDKVSKGLKELPVKTESNSSVALTRLILFALSRRILGLGLVVIGINPLDQI